MNSSFPLVHPYDRLSEIVTTLILSNRRHIEWSDGGFIHKSNASFLQWFWIVLWVVYTTATRVKYLYWLLTTFALPNPHFLTYSSIGKWWPKSTSYPDSKVHVAHMGPINLACMVCVCPIAQSYFATNFALEHDGNGIACMTGVHCLNICLVRSTTSSWHGIANPDSKVHGPNMGPTWGRQAPGGPHVGLMNFAILETMCNINEARWTYMKNMLIACMTTFAKFCHDKSWSISWCIISNRSKLFLTISKRSFSLFVECSLYATKANVNRLDVLTRSGLFLAECESSGRLFSSAYMNITYECCHFSTYHVHGCRPN